MSKYDQLPPNEKILADLVMKNGCLDKNRISESPMFGHCKDFRVLQIHEDTKEKLYQILKN